MLVFQALEILIDDLFLFKGLLVKIHFLLYAAKSKIVTISFETMYSLLDIRISPLQLLI